MTARRRIVIATGNRGKLAEIARVLAGFPFDFAVQSDFDVPEAAETGLTFVENAILKARNAAAFTGLPALADDSGLEVDALAGAPGIYSARYAGPGASDAENNDKLLAALADVPASGRGCRFRSVVVFLAHAGDPMPVIASGTWEGRVREAPSGGGGFGYDPLFEPAGLDVTAAELDPVEKNRRSHRGQALAALRSALSDAARP